MSDPNFDPYHEWLRIPPNEQPPNHYRLLGLELFEADRVVIEAVSLEQIAHIRTFAIGANSEASQLLLNELSSARVTLLNAVQKADYDKELRQQLNSTGLERSPVTAETQAATPVVTDGASTQVPMRPQRQRRLSRSFNEVNASPSDPGDKRKLYIRIGVVIVLGYLVFMGLLFLVRARGVSQEINIALNRGDYARVLELDPDNPAALSMQRSASDLADALSRKNYRRALSIDPYNAEALTLKREDLLGALLARDYEKALDIDPNNAEAKSQQKEAAAQQAVASGNYEQALELDLTNLEALAMRNSALAIEKKAEIEEALKAGDYARVLRLDRANAEALAMKQAVERKQAFAVGDNSAGLELDSANTAPLVMNEVDARPPPVNAPFDAAKAKEYQEAWAKYLGVEVETENSIGMKLRVIPPGTFTMGEEDTAHAVTLTKPFMLGKYEVTQAEYARVMHNNPSGFRAENNPVENVSWNDALEFCRRMSEIPAEKTAGRVYTLPTEAQWEYSCRAGTTTAYSFGLNVRSLDVYVWYNLNSGKTTHAVGRKKANPWGLCDMHGNVWEWCSDWYGNYPNTPALDPRGPDEGRSRVHRGNGGLNAEPGSPGWNNADYCTSASRGRHSPSFRTGSFGGFRVVCIVTPEDPDTNLDAKESQSDNSNTPTAAREPQPANAPFGAAKAKEHQEAWAKYLDVEVETENSIGMKLSVIPAGTFTMGENDDAHEVTLTKPFMLGTYEVTQAQYERVMGVNPSGRFKGAKYPVECVTWNDAAEFCRKLSGLPAEQAAGRVYHLPTAAQWDHACRSGARTKYYFGDDATKLVDYAWIQENNNNEGPSPVGTKRPNAWGLHDMYGNVYEWCNDWAGENLTTVTTDPTGAEKGSRRVERGGGWNSFANHVQIPMAAPPSSFTITIGFRVACLVLESKSTRGNHAAMDTKSDRSTKLLATPPDASNTAPAPANAPFDAAKAKEHQEAWAKYLGVEVETENSIGMKLRVIPAGTFTMGSDDGSDWEKPAHEVTLTKPFLLGEHEVTQAQYEKVMDINPSKFKGANNPVETVSWTDAVEFCRRLSELRAEKAAGRVYRLPTEAQWEYACRAGTTTMYSFGSDSAELGRYAWYSRNSDNEPHPVCSKQSNAWGLYDLYGNVFEWCQNRFRDYPSVSVTDPTGTETTSTVVARGGSWGKSSMSSSSRFPSGDVVRSSLGGFRVVCIVKPNRS